MRQIATVTVFTLDELSDTAWEKAIQRHRERLAGDWWDDASIEQVHKEITYTLAEKFQTPGWDTYEPADFPGIAGVELTGWDSDRTQSVAVAGVLSQVNAPGLPWVDGIADVVLTAYRAASTEVNIRVDSPSCTCPDPWQHEEDCAPVGPEVTAEQTSAMEDAVTDALHAAWHAGYQAMEHLTSEEYARKEIENNKREFTEDGELYE